MNRKGFTLIEMLIVVAIIAILAGSVLVGLGPVQKQGRDSRRISDLRQVQNALELYYNKTASYPTVSTWADLKTTLTTGSDSVTTNLPTDPRDGVGSYGYRYYSNGSTYVLATTLEDGGNSALKSDLDGTDVAGITVSCDDPVYCISL